MEAPKTVLPGDVNVISYCAPGSAHCRPVRWRGPHREMGCIVILPQKDKDSIPFISPNRRHSPTYLFFFSFFICLFSLRLFCAAFLLSFTPLLFSFITPSSLESFYVLALPFYKKRGTTTPTSASFRYPLCAKVRGISDNFQLRPCATGPINQYELIEIE